ncbi:MAG: single-stranded DNA-binding protein [Nakamurella sp.]
MSANVTIIGNLVREPKLSYSASENKTAICRFSVAVEQGFQESKKTHFVPVTVFGDLAENVASSLAKGQSVIVVGRLDTYTKQVEIDGEEKGITMVGFIGDFVGPSLKWATAKVSKVERDRDETPAPAAAKSRTKAAAPADDDEEDEAPAPKARPASAAKSRAKAPAATAPDEDDDF